MYSGSKPVVALYFLMILALLSACQTTPEVPHVGCMVSDPHIRGTYRGECNAEGEAHGYGTAQGEDTYQGHFIKGIKEGNGVYIWRNGDRFTGQFRNGLAEGKGVMEYIDGRRIEGIWQNNKLKETISDSHSNSQ